MPLADGAHPLVLEQGVAAQVALAGLQGAARPAGFKIGATAKRMQDYLGLAGPAAGFMAEAGLHGSGSTLAADMGARITSKGAVWVDGGMQTSIPRLYAAGDTTPGAQQALIAAAEGNRAAILINESLTREECPR